MVLAPAYLLARSPEAGPWGCHVLTVALLISSFLQVERFISADRIVKRLSLNGHTELT